MVKVKRLHEDAVILKYAKPGDSGFDLVAVEDVIIEPGETAVVKTGLAFEIPNGYEMQIRPRSEISRKTKLRVVLGTIDSGYRGEVGVIVGNIAEPLKEIGHDGVNQVISYMDGDTFTINNEIVDNLYEQFLEGTYIIRKGDRIAQGVFVAIGHTTFEEVEKLSESERGEGGFGSTGMNIPRQLEFYFEKGGVK